MPDAADSSVGDSSLAGLLFIGDPHLASRVPGFRKDDYPRTILAKPGEGIRRVGIVRPLREQVDELAPLAGESGRRLLPLRQHGRDHVVEAHACLAREEPDDGSGQSLTRAADGWKAPIWHVANWDANVEGRGRHGSPRAPR